MNTITCLDDPFVEVTMSVEVTSRRPSVMPRIVATPVGDEVVTQAELDEVTLVYDHADLERLRQASDPHKHLTHPQLATVQ